MKKMIVFIFLLICGNLLAQKDVTSKGKDFWFTFLPNYHNNMYDPDVKKVNSDSLYIYIYSEKTTKGKIYYKDKNNKQYETDFVISDVTKPFILPLLCWNFELAGFVASGKIDTTNGDCEKASPKSFHIVAEDEVNVLAHNQAIYTSESFMVYPSEILAKSYMVFTWNSHLNKNMFSTPSQFAIIATEENTKIKIKPSTPTRVNKKKEQNFTLNKGEVYLVQDALEDTIAVGTDLSGTEVTADKNIAIFGGQLRGYILINTNYMVLRDQMTSQLIPLNYFGYNYIIPEVCFDMLAENKDSYKIISAEDSNKITINDTLAINLNKGQCYTSTINKGVIISSIKPILVAQIKGVQWNQNNNIIGDLSMIIKPSVNQYLNSYQFLVHNNKATVDTIKKFQKFYALITADNNARNSITLDGNEIDPKLFTRVAMSDQFSYYLPIAEGLHNIKSDYKFSLDIYGLGISDGYGYNAGFNFVEDKLTGSQPSIKYIKKCRNSIIDFSEDPESDIYLSDLQVINAENIDYKISKFDNKRYQFIYSLIDRYQDGDFTIKATNSAGVEFIRGQGVPGYTLGFMKNNKIYHILSDTIDGSLGVKQLNYDLKNYGNYPVKIYKSIPFWPSDIANNLSTNFKDNTIIPTNTIAKLITSQNHNVEKLSSQKFFFLNECLDTVQLDYIYSSLNCANNGFFYTDILHDGRFNYIGDAKLLPDRLRITELKQNQTNAVWRKDKYPIGKSFNMELSLMINNPTNQDTSNCQQFNLENILGAEGCALVFQNSSPYAIGRGGTGLGYDSLKNALAIEFDGNYNKDIDSVNFSHIQIMQTENKIASSNHKSNNYFIPLNSTNKIVKRNQIWLQLQYNSDTKILLIMTTYYNRNYYKEIKVNNFDFSKLIDLENDIYGYIGFTGSTGCAYENYDIWEWGFCSLLEPIVSVEENVRINEDININYFENNINIKFKEFKQIENILLYDINGSLISELKPNNNYGNNFNIPLMNIINGAYILKIKTSNEVYNKLFLKY